MDKIAVEKKWNKLWEEQKVYSFNPKDIDNKYYMLEMFSYPSGAKIAHRALVQLRTFRHLCKVSDNEGQKRVSAHGF